ncbi:MAG: NAD(P)-dependent oxidoreductase [Alphaproteobacteria bacterium]|nr:MAG: NAD(P)-dependent oxidoreductase [Alphaproteobacteria bacterium]
MERLAFIGFGEAATAFLTGWADRRPARVSAFDIKTDAPQTRTEMLARYEAHVICGAMEIAAALEEAEAVFSVVTADQALAAARAAAPALPEGALWLDCNSCAPETKRRAAEAIEAAGGRYVDVAVMAPVRKLQHRVPLLVSGPHAGLACAVLRGLDMRPEIAGDTVGQASTVKMLRSVMVKGLEALCAECFLAARRAGVEAQVLASLEASDPDIDWRHRASYNLERMMVHGTRRAAEMREVAATLSALGLPGGLSPAIAEWQEAIARLGLDPGADELSERLDRVLAKL